PVGWSRLMSSDGTLPVTASVLMPASSPVIGDEPIIVCAVGSTICVRSLGEPISASSSADGGGMLTDAFCSPVATALLPDAADTAGDPREGRCVEVGGFELSAGSCEPL